MASIHRVRAPGHLFNASVPIALVGLLCQVGLAQTRVRAADPAGCKAGSADACFRLAGALFKGQVGSSRDLGRAVKIWDKACQLGHPEACRELARRHFALGLQPRRAARLRKKALELELTRCTAGHARACARRAALLDRGEEGLRADPRHAAKLADKGCSGGDAEACIRLGLMYATGRGVAKDRKRAILLQRKGCRLDYVLCRGLIRCVEGPSIHHKGGDYCPAGAVLSLSELVPLVVKTVRRVCSGGDARACGHLSEFCDRKHKRCPGVDPEGALMKACAGGFEHACSWLGGPKHSPWSRARPGGAPFDRRRAAALAKACKRGVPVACHGLALAFEQGRGVKANPARARRTRQAAERAYQGQCNRGQYGGCIYLAVMKHKQTARAAALVKRARKIAAVGCKYGIVAECSMLTGTLVPPLDKLAKVDPTLVRWSIRQLCRLSPELCAQAYPKVYKMVHGNKKAR